MRDKWAIREAVWTALETARVVRGKSVHDKIPHFLGCEDAAALVSDLPEWQAARAVKSNPDQAQRPLRQLALEQGKLLYMAVPRLKEERVFIELDPGRPEVDPKKASTISGAFKVGRPVYVDEMQPVDLVISGSVAVNRQGVRIGKGGGFADLEYGLAAAAGILTPDTPVITTVASDAGAGRRTAVDATRRPAGFRGYDGRGDPLRRRPGTPLPAAGHLLGGPGRAQNPVDTIVGEIARRTGFGRLILPFIART